MVQNDIYSHIELYDHLNWNHTKDRNGKSAINTIKGARNLDDSSLELWM